MSQEDERFKKMIEDSPDWFWEFDERANFTYVSPRIRDLLGYEPEDLIGRNAFDLMDASEADRVRHHFDPIAKKFLPFSHLINVNRHKDGHEVVIESSGTPIFDNDGHFRGYRGIDRDITNRTKTEAELLRRKKLFRDFFEINPVATIITSLSGVIEMINPAFSRVSGYFDEEAVGRTTIELGFWSEAAERDSALKKILQEGRIDNLAVVYFDRKKNKEKNWLLSSRLIDYENQKRILSIILDVTEQREAEKALRDLDQARNDFIKIAAHELNTPLLAVLGFAELLENSHKDQLSEKGMGYLSTIISNSEILQRLIKDLLDVEKIQVNHSLNMVRDKVPFTRFIKKAISSITTEYPEYKFILSHVNSPPEVVNIDEERMTQVMSNLLSNAAKYSSKDKEIEIFTETQGNSIVISIRDHGIGMSSEQVEKIFNKFYRGTVENPQTGGLGLGMYIVKQIVEEHGGSIWISSQEGLGTTVAFKIPLVVSEN